MLDHITPLILTYNEAPNIGRTLGRLAWARDIVVVDSFSADDTLKIVAGFPPARVFQRKFDTHGQQWNFGLQETGIASEWVLALDADYVLTAQLIEELKTLAPEANTHGYRASFVYCVNGKPLSGSAYPPVTVLYRRANARYVQDGHTQRIEVAGEVRDLQSAIRHDDRKPLGHWLQAQARYMRIEAGKLAQADVAGLSWADRLRKMKFIAPLGMLLYCLIVKRAILDGPAGLYYALQRTVAELILSLYLVEHDLRRTLRQESAAPVRQNLPPELIGEVKEQG